MFLLEFFMVQVRHQDPERGQTFGATEPWVDVGGTT